MKKNDKYKFFFLIGGRKLFEKCSINVERCYNSPNISIKIDPRVRLEIRKEVEWSVRWKKGDEALSEGVWGEGGCYIRTGRQRQGT